MKTPSILALTLLCYAPCMADTQNLFNENDFSDYTLFLEDSLADASQVFSVENGVLNIAGNPFGYVATKDEFSNFYLHVEWRYPEDPSNSGIFLFVQNDDAVWPNTIECQLKDGRAADFVLLGGSNMQEYVLPEGTERPKFPIVKRNEGDFEKPAGEWNSADIICQDGRITVFINGKLANTGKAENDKGRIALQSEGGKIQFRNVHITELD